jgi:PAS domain-containing protein
MTDLSIEVRTGRRWLHIISRPHHEDTLMVWDGIITDITKRKSNETKLARYREKLEYFVQERTDELTATNEVLVTANEELTTTVEELDHYKTHLEAMVEQKTLEVISEKNHLQTLADNIPNGFLNRVRIKASVLSGPDAATEWSKQLQLIFASANAEKLTGISIADAMKDYSLAFTKYHREDLVKVAPLLFEHFCDRTPLNIEIRFFRSGNDMRWLQMSIWFTDEDGWVICNGLILDVTERKEMEIELALYRENLEQLVKKRTDELSSANEELVVTIEELRATNEELSATNEELSATNE